MKLSKGTIISVSIMAAVLAGALVYYNVVDKTVVESGTNVGETCLAQDIELIHGQEGVWNVNNNRGKVTVINFWATWCTGCIAELPDFEKVYLEYGDKLDIIAIDEDPNKTLEFVNSKIDEKFEGFTLNFGRDDIDQTYYKAFGGSGALPMTIIVDKEGIIQYKAEASMNEAKLKEIIDPII